MDWIKRIIKKFHPQNLLDLFVDAVLLLMEIWAVLRVALIMIIVMASIILYAVERATCEYNETKWDEITTLWEDQLNLCDEPIGIYDDPDFDFPINKIVRIAEFEGELNEETETLVGKFKAS